MKSIYLILKKIFIISLPAIGFVFANISAESHKSFCLIKFLFGHSCWGCGLTRAFAALSGLNFKEAIEFNPLIIVVAPLFFVLWVLLIKKYVD